MRTRLLAVLAVSVVVSVGLFLLGWGLCYQQQQATVRALQTCLYGLEEPPLVQVVCNQRFPGRQQQVQREFSRERTAASLQRWAKSKGWEPPTGIGPDD